MNCVQVQPDSSKCKSASSWTSVHVKCEWNTDGALASGGTSGGTSATLEERERATSAIRFQILRWNPEANYTRTEYIHRRIVNAYVWMCAADLFAHECRLNWDVYKQMLLAILIFCTSFVCLLTRPIRFSSTLCSRSANFLIF